MLNEHKILDKLDEIISIINEQRMSYFDSFPEDAVEERISWNMLYDMATDDYSKINNVKSELQSLIEGIECCEYDEE